MPMDELKAAVAGHTGEFLCERIHDGEATKVVRFTHEISPPEAGQTVPDVGQLRAFYATFGSIRFYLDPVSGDSGRYLARPSEWADLDGYFREWTDDLMDEDDDLPDWLATCLVIGETPHSGNYILMPTTGALAGHVMEFDHDGFEFVDRGDSLAAYVQQLLAPDSETLTNLASLMRFIEGGSDVQWWIAELRDNRGRVVRTEA